MRQFLLCIGAICSAGILQGSVIVPDFSFETPNANGGFLYPPSLGSSAWTFSGHAGIFGTTYAMSPLPNGVQSAFIQQCDANLSCGTDPAGSSNFFQSLSGFTIGHNYNVTFSIAERTASTCLGTCDPEPFLVQVGSNNLGTFTPSGGWAPVTTLSFVATSNSMTLSFTGVKSLLGSGREADVTIDNVQVNDLNQAVPEPATFAFMGAAGVALLLARKRVTRR
jgi:hypothetical protein